MTSTRTKNNVSAGKTSKKSGGRPEEFWHRTMSRQVVNACQEKQNTAGWEAWTKYLKQRPTPATLDKMLKVRQPALLWALPDELVGSDTETLIRELCELAKSPSRDALGETIAQQLDSWLVEATGVRPGVAYLLECVALCHALPSLAPYLPAKLWWNLFDHLLETASVSISIATASPHLKQLQMGELPLAMFYQFPEIQPCRDLRSPARDELSKAITALLDGEGMLDSKHFDAMYSLLALWTRCKAMGDTWKKDCWNPEAEEQYEWAVRQAIRFLRSDGGRMFSRVDSPRARTDLFLAALQHGGDEEDYAAAKMVLPNSGLGTAKSVDEDDLPAPAANSEWAGVALLRRNWSRQCERLAVKYGESDIEVELCSGEEVLLTGIWEADIRVEGKSLRKELDWEEVCWYSDDDVDYLEIETDLAHGYRLQRQFLLAREDRFLILADIVLGGNEAKAIDYQGHLPMADEVQFSSEKETREIFLHSRKRSALVIPMALNEWRDAPAPGELTSSEGRLTLSQTATGRNLCCPLFIDLDPRRMAKDRTWRQLTVAEELEIQNPDVAVGYRVQCGKAQWMYYRSLVESANRTLLGQNLSTDCMVGRFTREGEVDELLEIE